MKSPLTEFPIFSGDYHLFYKLDEETFVYLEQLNLGLTDEEQELMENPVDRWGQEWRKFMQTNYPEEIPSLQGRLKWEIIPRR